MGPVASVFLFLWVRESALPLVLQNGDQPLTFILVLLGCLLTHQMPAVKEQAASCQRGTSDMAGEASLQCAGSWMHRLVSSLFVLSWTLLCYLLALVLLSTPSYSEGTVTLFLFIKIIPIVATKMPRN